MDYKKLYQQLLLKNSSLNSRRHFLKNCTLGIGGIALSNFLSSCNTNSPKKYLYDNERALNPLAPIPPPGFANAKSVIYLHMVGAPSQLELFEYKPCLLYTSPSPRDS